MTVHARIELTGASVAPIDARIYGQYFEHTDDCIYPGVHDGENRADVIALASDLGVPSVRWPGGCFADVYHWQDGVGTTRPLRRNQHWGGLESNAFGTHEFLNWCEATGAAPYVNVNLGTGTLDEALRWLDYVNGSEPTADVLERRANGRERPWDVRTWGIGNETWAHWEAGQMDAAAYAQTLANWSEFFRTYDRDLEIVAVGSRSADDEDWDATVLRRAGHIIDLLSVHLYGSTMAGRPTPASVVCTPVYLERRLELMIDRVRRHTDPSVRRVRIAVDEWNIRHYRPHSDADGGGLDRTDPRDADDALFAAGMFHAMIRHSDMVALANYVFLVNGHGVIQTRDGAARPTALFDVFRHYRTHLSGERVDVAVTSPHMAPPEILIEHPGYPADPTSTPTDVAVLDAVAARAADGRTHLALINRHADETLEVALPDDVRASWRLDADGRIVVIDPSAATVLPPHSLTFAVI